MVGSLQEQCLYHTYLIATPHQQSIPCLGSQFQGSLWRNPSGRADIVELSESHAHLFICTDLHKTCFCFPVTFCFLFDVCCPLLAVLVWEVLVTFRKITLPCFFTHVRDWGCQSWKHTALVTGCSGPGSSPSDLVPTLCEFGLSRNF